MNLFGMANVKKILLLVLALSLISWSLAGCNKKAGKDTALPDIPKEKQFKILFLGDTSFGENYGGTPERLEKYGYEFPLQKVAPMLKSSNFIIANLETPITDIKDSPFADTKPYNHWTHVKHAPETLAKYNIKTLSMANNHTLDYGIPGLKQTLDIMKSHDMSWIGAGMNEAEAKKPFLKTFDTPSGPFKLAVLAAFEYRKSYDVKFDFYAGKEKPGTWKLSPKRMAKEIKKIREKDPDTFIVVYPHWGANYRWRSNNQRKYAREFIDAGADMVIGHGAHCIQEIEKYNDKWIVYSLGNFVFLSRGRYKQKNAPPYSFGAQMILAESGGRQGKWMRLYPIVTNNKITKYQARPLKDEEFTKFKTLFYKKSKLEETGLSKLIRAGQDEGGKYLEFAI